MRYLPKMQQLRVFQEVVRQGSIRSAARALSQSQPAISRTLKALENTLQAALFERGPSGITLTASGELFAVRSRLILAELLKAGEEIHQLHQHQAQLTVGMSALPGLMVLPAMLERCQQMLPPVSLTVKEDTLHSLFPAVAAGEIDFAIGQLPACFTDERLIIKPLFSTPLCVAVSHYHPRCQHGHQPPLVDEKWLVLEGEGDRHGGPPPEQEALFQQLSHPLLNIDSLVYALSLVTKADYLMVMPRPLLVEFGHVLRGLNLPLQSVRHYSVIRSRHSPLTLQAQQLLALVIDICQGVGAPGSNGNTNQGNGSAPAQRAFSPLSWQ